MQPPRQISGYATGLNPLKLVSEENALIFYQFAQIFHGIDSSDMHFKIFLQNILLARPGRPCRMLHAFLLPSVRSFLLRRELHCLEDEHC